jgi:hypothetical protein
MPSVSTKTSPFKDIPSGAIAKWRIYSEQRASHAGKKELTPGPTLLAGMLILPRLRLLGHTSFWAIGALWACLMSQDIAATLKKQATDGKPHQQKARRKPGISNFVEYNFCNKRP